MTRRDQHGHLHPLSKTQCLLTETTKVSPRHPEASESDDTQRPIWSFDDPQCLLTETIAVSITSSRDIQVWWRAETVMVAHSRCSDTIKVPYHPETSKSDGMQGRWCRPFLIVFIWDCCSPFFYPETIKSDGTQAHTYSSASLGERFNVYQPKLLKSPLLSWDERVR